MTFSCFSFTSQDVGLISKKYLSFQRFEQNSAWKNTECKEELFLFSEGWCVLSTVESKYGIQILSEIVPMPF
jgi:hypothetical protein